MKKIIIFDMDGVLIDSEEISRQYMMERYPEMTPEAHKELSCGNFHEEMQKFISQYPAKNETPEEIEARQAAFAIKKSQCGMFDGMYELVKALHGDGYVIAINTSAIERNCMPLLERVGIASMIDFFGTKEVSVSKVEKFKIIQEKYQADSDDILFVTDTLGDLREADIANIPTVAVTWGMHDHSYFKREPHENLRGIAGSAEELQEFIYS